MSINVDKAFETTENGVLLTDADGNQKLYLTSGVGAPSGPAPINSWYFREDTQTLYYKYGALVTDWRQVRGNDIAVGTPGNTYKPATTTVSSALAELRNTLILERQEITTTLNGIEHLEKDDYSFLDIVGTATGFAVRLPDATTLVVGRTYKLVNDSSETIEVQDFGGNKLFDLIASDYAEVILQVGNTAAGAWVTLVSSSTATGIISYTIDSSTPFSTTSSTDVLIPGMSVTPVSGRYAVWFNGDIDITQNNRLAQCVIKKGVATDEKTRRVAQGVSSNFNTSFHTIGIVNVNGSETVEVLINISSGNLTIVGRSLILIRLGQ